MLNREPKTNINPPTSARPTTPPITGPAIQALSDELESDSSPSSGPFSVGSGIGVDVDVDIDDGAGDEDDGAAVGGATSGLSLENPLDDTMLGDDPPVGIILHWVRGVGPTLPSHEYSIMMGVPLGNVSYIVMVTQLSPLPLFRTRTRLLVYTLILRSGQMADTRKASIQCSSRMLGVVIVIPCPITAWVL